MAFTFDTTVFTLNTMAIMTIVSRYILCLHLWIHFVAVLINPTLGIAQAHLELIPQSPEWYLGDTLSIQIKISMDEDAIISNIDLSIPSKLPDFIELFSETAWDTLSAKHAYYLTKTAVLLAFDTGWIHLPPSVLSYQFDGELNAYSSDTLKLFVSNLDAFPDGVLAPPAGLLHLKERLFDKSVFLWFLSLAVAIILSFWLWRIWRKKQIIARQLPIIEKDFSVASPELDVLNALKNVDYTLPTEEFCNKISGLVKSYLCIVCDIRNQGLTVEEVLQQTAYPVLEKQKEKLRQWMNISDLARFSKGHLDLDWRQTTQRKIVELLEEIQSTPNQENSEFTDKGMKIG